MAWYENNTFWTVTVTAIVTAVGSALVYVAKTYLWVKKTTTEIESKSSDDEQRRTMLEQNVAIEQLIQVMDAAKAGAKAELDRERESHKSNVDRLEATIGRMDKSANQTRAQHAKELARINREHAEEVDGLRQELEKLQQDCQACLIQKARYEEIIRSNGLSTENSGLHRPLPPGGKL